MRTALLIRCTTNEAEKIRAEARNEGRTISSYVIGVSMRTLENNELVRELAVKRPHEPRTAILVRCAQSEAERIRYEVKRRGIPLNTFVLNALKQSWMKVSTLRSIAKSTS
jgi:hypothetical protein